MKPVTVTNSRRLTLVLAFLIAAAGARYAQDYPDTPPITGTSVSAPPMQELAWNPSESECPEDFVTAAGLPLEQGRSLPAASRVCPAYEEWMVPVCPIFEVGHDKFEAEMMDEARQSRRAEWKLEGPQQDERSEEVVRIDGRASSKYDFKVQEPGDYELTCTFVGEGGVLGSASWSAVVDSDAWAARGRKVDPSEPGTMIFIKGGIFTMGAPAASALGGEDAVPAHEVRIDDFYIGKYLVTAKEFCEFLNERGNPEYRYLVTDEKVAEDARAEAKAYAWPTSSDEDYKRCNLYRDPETGEFRPRGNRAYCPANQVTWFGAVEYCRWLSERTGRKYRLPTEAEWEYAARGEEGRKYPWGSTEPFPGGRSATPDPALKFGLSHTDPETTVGSYPRGNTPEGVTDMTGGMGQWCSDVYSETYYSVSPRDNPKGPVIVAEERAGTHRATLRRAIRGLGMTRYSSYDAVIPTIPYEYHVIQPAWSRSNCMPWTSVPNRAGFFLLYGQGFRVVMELPENSESAGPVSEGQLIRGIPSRAEGLVIVDLAHLKLLPGSRSVVDGLLRMALDLEPLTSERVKTIAVFISSSPGSARPFIALSGLLTVKDRAVVESLHKVIKDGAKEERVQLGQTPAYRMNERLWLCVMNEDTLACAETEQALRGILEVGDQITEPGKKLGALLMDYAGCPVRGAMFLSKEHRANMSGEGTGDAGLTGSFVSGAFGVRWEDEMASFNARGKFETAEAAGAAVGFLRQRIEQHRELLEEQATAFGRSESVPTGAQAGIAVKTIVELLTDIKITQDKEDVTVSLTAPAEEFGAFWPMVSMLVMQ